MVKSYFLQKVLTFSMVLVKQCVNFKKELCCSFIDLARSVYFTNDERAKVKNDINKTFGSELVEVKSYEEY